MLSFDELDLLLKYQELNSSFKKKLVYKFDTNENFYSEFNNMILSILYCLENEIQFQLYSKHGLLSISEGWQDYFLPFCTESTNHFHKKFNQKTYNDQVTSFYAQLRILIHKRLNKIDYCTQEILPLCKSQYNSLSQPVYVPQLELYKNVKHALQELSNMVYKYSPRVNESISYMVSRLNLPPRYAALHLSGGDNIEKFKKYTLTDYIDVLKKHTKLQDVFVMTDDYNLFNRLNTNFPEYSFYTNCKQDDKGNHEEKLLNLPKEERFREHLRFLTAMEALRSAAVAIVPFNTHPGTFLGMSDKNSKVIGIDQPDWEIR